MEAVPVVVGARRYAGVLDGAHWLSGIRTALIARGVEVDPAAARTAVARFGAEGERLRDDTLARRLREEWQVGGFDAAVGQPIFERLPLMAGLGALQARSLERAAGVRGEPTVVLGAAFNTAIALLDHLVDDLAGAALFDVVDAGLVHDLFASPEQARAAVRRAVGLAPTGLTAIVVGLIGVCAGEGWELVQHSGETDTWVELGGLVARLLAAEAAVATPGNRTAQDLAQAARLASAGPAQVLRAAVTLTGRETGNPARLDAATHLLGELFWQLDDLVDLLEDDEQGQPNRQLARAYQAADAGSRRLCADADLYDALEAAAGELADLLARLRPTALGPLATTVTAAWTGWITEEPPPARPVLADPEPGAPLLRAAAAGRDALLAASAEGYAKAAHHLRFPRLAGGGAVYEEHPAVLSFRGVALDALLDARDAGLPVPAAQLARDALAVLRAKHRSVRGGWNYIPAVEELPPDLDDLGQVLQVLSRLGGQALAATCDEPARLAVDAQDADGGICTWILDPRGTSAADRRVRAYLPIMGGWGVHPEVVANFAAGLLSADRQRWAAPLGGIARYLASVQEADGSWTSKWYAGPYYGTWRAVAVLQQLAPGSHALDRAQEGLTARRLDGGAWGDAVPDPLDTALALLALAELDRVPRLAGPADADLTDPALAWLLSAQDSDGTWPARPWIVFPTLDGLVSYGSTTMTTAFCLKALCAALGRPGCAGLHT